MGTKTNVLLGGMALAGIGLGAGAFVFAYMNQPAKEVTGEVTGVDLASVAGYPLDSEAEELAVELTHVLNGGNTLITWHCGKVQAGQRHDFTGTFKQIAGAVVYDADPATLRAIELRFLLESFVGYGSEHPAPPALTNTVVGDSKWFDWETHPDAVFTATTFTERDAVGEEVAVPADAPDGWTHLIEGEFQLNGVTEPFVVPAVVTFSGERVSIDAAFTFDRQAFNVVGSNLPATVVDDEVTIHAEINASPDPAEAVSMIASLVDEQGKLLAAQSVMIQDLSDQIAVMGDRFAEIDRAIASGAAAGGGTPAVDVSELEPALTVTDPTTALDYELVLVPGDPDAGIAPYYMMKYEVTWAQFRTFAFCEDLDDAGVIADLRDRNLRPSPGYGDMSQGFDFGDQPALRMSRLNAERFCDWLNENTGRNFRIPTEDEWELALRLGGNDPDATEPPANILDIAVTDDDFAPLPVGSKQPNALGIHDMLGNVAEWVTATGAERVVRGGSFFDVHPTGALREVEDQDIWNAGYPQDPKSKWWYVDAFDVGLRLVCDPE